jgi:hypothetical protein
MIAKRPALAKAGVAGFSDKIMRKIKRAKSAMRFDLNASRSMGPVRQR